MEVETINTSAYFNHPENLTLSKDQLFITAQGAIWKMNIRSQDFEVVYNDVGIEQSSGIDMSESGVLTFTDNLGSDVKYIVKSEVSEQVSNRVAGYADGKKENVQVSFPKWNYALRWRSSGCGYL